MSLLLVSRDTALDGQQELHLSPGLQNLVWYGYHRDLKLRFLQPHNRLAMQYHRLLLSLISSPLPARKPLCGLVNQLAKEAAPRKLQSLVLARGRQATLPGVLCGTPSGGCHFHQTQVGGPGEPKAAKGIRREDSS